MLKTFYYVDTENIAYKEYENLLSSAITPKDVLILIYTDKSKTMHYDDMESLMNLTTNVRFLRCFNGTPNALDFCLCARVGEGIKSAPKSRHVIISNDKGFTAISKMYSNMGYNVTVLPQEDTLIGMKQADVETQISLKEAWKQLKDELYLHRDKYADKADYDRMLNFKYRELEKKYLSMKELNNRETEQVTAEEFNNQEIVR